MNLDWTKQDNLVPAIVQHADTLQVLMLGYMNQEALTKTIESQRVFFSVVQSNVFGKKVKAQGTTLKSLASKKTAMMILC
jgi:phosphoribosyl-ATP pyrophosphohydrolase/phosphoribosyl-AMP cyclohydrolase